MRRSARTESGGRTSSRATGGRNGAQLLPRATAARVRPLSTGAGSRHRPPSSRAVSTGSFTTATRRAGSRYCAAPEHARGRLSFSSESAACLLLQRRDRRIAPGRGGLEFVHARPTPATSIRSVAWPPLAPQKVGVRAPPPDHGGPRPRRRQSPLASAARRRLSRPRTTTFPFICCERSAHAID